MALVDGGERGTLGTAALDQVLFVASWPGAGVRFVDGLDKVLLAASLHQELERHRHRSEADPRPHPGLRATGCQQLSREAESRHHSPEGRAGWASSLVHGRIAPGWGWLSGDPPCPSMEQGGGAPLASPSHSPWPTVGLWNWTEMW